MDNAFKKESTTSAFGEKENTASTTGAVTTTMSVESHATKVAATNDEEQPTTETTVESIVIKDESIKKKYASDLILVLDLDETLWWAPGSPQEYEEFKRQGWNPSDIGVEHGVLAVRPHGWKFSIPLKLRPGVLEFRKATALSKKYETIIFTRGTQSGIAPSAIETLAKAVVEYSGDDSLSADDVFSDRYYSGSCKDVMGLGMWYCKPLKQVVRAARGDIIPEDDLLKRIVIVDDRSDSYSPCNKFNGIRVKSFFGIREEDDDAEESDYGEDSVAMFGRLTELLETLEPEEDVRPVLKAMFRDGDRKYL